MKRLFVSSFEYVHMFTLRYAIVAAAVAVALAGAAGCKQGRGERCQVSEDCEDGLTCSQAEPKTCGGADETQIDACVPSPETGDCVTNPVDAAVDAAAANDPTPGQ